MQPRIETLKSKITVGRHISMSFTMNKTSELWQSFMPVRKEIINIIGTELYSLEVFPANYFSNFNPANSFEKWAAVEVSDVTNIPDGFDVLEIPTGLYAVFIHKGPASKGPEIYHHIFNNWLPHQGMQLMTGRILP